MILRRARDKGLNELANPAGAGEPGAAAGASEPATGAGAGEPGAAAATGEPRAENGTWGGANGAGDAAAATVAVETIEATASSEPDEPTTANEPGPTPEPSARICPRCSSPLAADQEWCLECGTASTRIRTPPDWRIPVAVVAAVIAIAVAGFIVAIDRLSATPSNSGGRPAPPSASASGLVTISEWPPHVAGWTVVLAHSRSAAVAYAKATKLANQGVATGVLNPSQHPGLVPGNWIVFSGRYGTKGQANAAAATLASRGHRGAHAKLVEQPQS